MKVKIYPSKIKGTIKAPPSKSATHRAIIIASLASGKSVIKGILLSDDTKSTINALEKLGVKISQKRENLYIGGSRGNLKASSKPIFLGNSGSSMRMLATVAALAKGKTILEGEKRLNERPMKDLLDALNSLGIKARSLKNNGCPPIEITGGEIKGKTVTISGSVSSQYITALLLISPFAKQLMEIIVKGELRSKPYVALTINMMKTFGVKVINKNFKNFIIPKGQFYKATNYTVEGDYSSASYLFGAAAATSGKITVKNIKVDSAQGDKYFLDILEKMGCKISKNKNSVTLTAVKKLLNVSLNMNNYPDIVQTLAAVSAHTNGKTEIKNIGHLKDKETDRISATARELTKMGIKVSTTNDSLKIFGGKPKGAVIDTHNDHRMAMSFAVAAINASGPTTIKNADVVNKSYPNFWKDFKKIGAKIEII